MTSSSTKKPAKPASKRASSTRNTTLAQAKTPARRAKPAAKPATSPAKGAMDSPIPTPAPDAASPVVVKHSPVSVSGPDLKKQELLSKVVAKSGIAKRDAKPVVEAMLDLIGEALNEGRDVNLNPMGKIIVKKSKPVSGGTVLTARIRVKQKT